MQWCGLLHMVCIRPPPPTPKVAEAGRSGRWDRMEGMEVCRARRGAQPASSTMSPPARCRRHVRPRAMQYSSACKVR